MTEPEIWGELGPAMRELNPMQQDFVRALVATKPGWGAVTRAARKAGYGKNSKAATLSKHAYHMSRDERIIAAVAEESKKVLRLGHAEAFLRCSTSCGHRTIVTTCGGSPHF